jgi:Secretion system C-terminal sorting domain
VYPNPTDGPIQLIGPSTNSKGGMWEMELLSSNGQLIQAYRGTMGRINDALNQDFANLAPGMYCIRMQAIDARMVRVVKE